MLLRDLQPASFRGVRFLVPSDEAEEGRNSIEHNYPDSSLRYMEDNGAIPPCFSVTAILHGANLPGQLNALRGALMTPGPGTLKHPVYGAQFVAVDGTYRIKREDRDAGVITLDIKFKVTGAPVFPGLVSGIAALVTGLAGAAVTAAFAAFVKSFGAPQTAFSGSLSGVSRGALETAIADIAVPLDRFFGGATSSPARLIDDAGLLLDRPETLAEVFEDALRAPFEAIDTRAGPAPASDDDPVTLSAVELIRGYRAALGEAAVHSELAAAIQPTTLDLVARKEHLSSLAGLSEAALFCCLAEAMAGRAYTTAEQVEADEKLLTETFATLQSRGLPAEIHAQCADIMVATSEVLSEAIVRLPRTVEIDPLNTPASVLAYELYEDDARLWQVVDLNPDQDPVLLARAATVLMRQV